VAILSKAGAELSNTAWAQGGVCCVLSPEDSFAQHVADTLDAGAGLCDQKIVEMIVADAPERMAELCAWGMRFDGMKNGTLSDASLGREGGHTQRRILHTGDTTGRAIAEVLLAQVRQHKNITLLEGRIAVDLITTARLGSATEDRVLGLYVYDTQTQAVDTLRCSRVVLATGGCGRVYLYTTNPEIATGDGVALAWRAGAVISNMEFVQFHPTCLYHTEVKNFLISEALRGEGARLVGADGREFMHKYDKRGALAPRDIVARAIDQEIKRTGQPCVYLDITNKSQSWLEERFPQIYARCRALGIDIATQPIPVVPAAHYQCGGVRTDSHGRTSIRGLYAIGEVACTGLHGANRLASNSLLEGTVMAHRAAQDVVKKLPLGAEQDLHAYEVREWKSGDVQDIDELVVIHHNWDEIRRLMWDYVSIVRTTKRLQRAAVRLQNLQREVQEFYWNFRLKPELLELRNLVQVASLIVESALRRRESRGLHCTLDFPQLDERERHDTLLRRV
jgi:L-aspartate oxidase